MSYLINLSPGSWVRGARRDLDDLNRQLLDAPADDQDRLRKEIADLQAELNQRINLIQQNVGWR